MFSLNDEFTLQWLYGQLRSTRFQHFGASDDHQVGSCNVKFSSISIIGNQSIKPNRFPRSIHSNRAVTIIFYYCFCKKVQCICSNRIFNIDWISTSVTLIYSLQQFLCINYVHINGKPTSLPGMRHIAAGGWQGICLSFDIPQVRHGEVQFFQITLSQLLHILKFCTVTAVDEETWVCEEQYTSDLTIPHY